MILYFLPQPIPITQDTFKQQDVNLVTFTRGLYYHYNTEKMVGGGDGEKERGEEGKNPYIYKTIMENKKYL